MRPLALDPPRPEEVSPERPLAAPAADAGQDGAVALAALVARTGPFCALCDAPVLSELRAVRGLPACPPCAAACADAPAGDEADAWPDRLAADAEGEAPLLPFRIELVEVAAGEDGQPRRLCPVPERELAAFREAYRRGDVRCGRGRVEVALEPEDRRSVAAWILATPGPRAEAVDALLALTRQNGVLPSPPDGSWTDRRVEMRTLALFRALDFADLLDRAYAEGADEGYEALLDLLRDAVEGTGFWGVWVGALAAVPGAQALLRETLSGTAPREWTLP